MAWSMFNTPAQRDEAAEYEAQRRAAGLGPVELYPPGALQENVNPIINAITGHFGRIAENIDPRTYPQQLRDAGASLWSAGWMGNDPNAPNPYATPQPVDVEGNPAPPPSDEGEREFMSPETWRRFVESGGETMVINTPSGKTTIKNKPNPSPEEKARVDAAKKAASAAGLGPESIASSRQPQGMGLDPNQAIMAPGHAPTGAQPMPPQARPPQAGPPQAGPPQAGPPQAGPPLPTGPMGVTPSAPAPAGPSPIPGGAPMPPPTLGGQTIEQLRAEAAKRPHVSRYTEGDKPMGAAAWERKKRETILERASEQERLLAEGNPEKAALLSRAYDRVNKRTGTGTKILLGLLSGNPFWTDTMAAYEADEEAKEKRYTSEQRREISTKKYDSLLTLIDGYEERLEKRRKEVAQELNNILVTDPSRLYSRPFMRDVALTMNIPEEHVEQFLDDHYDPVTGAYTIIKNPQEEAYIRIKNDAEVIRRLNPGMSIEMAIASAKHPELWLKFVQDSELRYESMARDADRTPQEREMAARMAEEARVSKTRVHNPAYIKVYELERLRSSDTIWGRMSAEERKVWSERYKQALDEYLGPSPGRDPEDEYLKRRKSVLDIQNAAAELTLRQMQIKEGGRGAGKTGKEVRPADIYSSIVTKNNPIMGSGKPGEVAKANAYKDNENLIYSMKYMPMPTGDTPEEKEMRNKANTVRNEVWNTYFSPAAQNTFKELDYEEAAFIAETIYKIQSDPNGYANPNMDAIYDWLRAYRELKKSRPQERKKFLGIF